MSGVSLNRDKAKACIFSEAKAKSPLGVSTAQAYSEANSALLNSARLAPCSEAKAVCAMPTSPCKAESSREAILDSPMTKKKAFNAKPKGFQSKRANIQSPRVFVLNRLSPINTYLRDYLSNK